MNSNMLKKTGKVNMSDKTLKEQIFFESEVTYTPMSLNTPKPKQVVKIELDRLMQLIKEDRERAVLEGKMDLISWVLSRTSMSELKQRWKELEDELAKLSNPTQEKEEQL